MATEVTHIVDPGEGAGHDYHSLSLWEAGEQGDLTGVRDEIAVARCRATDGDADTTLVTIDSWTTSATQYIKIWTDPAESYRHDGKWNTGKYRLDVGTEWGTALSCKESYVKIIGIQVITNHATNRWHCLEIDGGAAPANSNIEIDSCILRRSGSSASTATLFLTGATVTVWNTLVYGASNAGIWCNYGIYGVTVNLYNCTSVGHGTHGIDGGSGSNTITVKNCYSGGNSGNDYNGSFDVMTTCASEDATGSAGLQGIAYSTSSGTYFTNITANSEDFHIGASSSLINAGTDLSATFTTDIDGVTRSGTWDIGADEYVAAITDLSIHASECVGSDGHLA